MFIEVEVVDQIGLVVNKNATDKKATEKVIINTAHITAIRGVELRYDSKTGEKIERCQFTTNNKEIEIAESEESFIKRAGIEYKKLNKEIENA